MSLHDDLTAFLRIRYPELPAAARAVMERSRPRPRRIGPGRTGPAAGRRGAPLQPPHRDRRHRRPGLPAVRGSGRAHLLPRRLVPYCNLALRALQQHHAEITARGARLVAISPQIPDESLTLTEKHALAFDVLSDLGSGTAKQYGLSFDLPDDLAAVYDSFGFDLQRVNGGHPRTLPLPATYVIDPDATIRWAFLDTDYTARAEPSDILAALDVLPRRPE